ncbi:hypothetical protein AMTRI_Chr13g125360 [Amborella trichopoda]|uniref:Uncharacterized protein n=1 Tax=Amborella trichopoda TaxID=13333 RepID=U5D877_AMBTC|nr:hypothetical protein AMTR_s00059p00169190 [Amborella trichopoda]
MHWVVASRALAIAHDKKWLRIGPKNDTCTGPYLSLATSPFLRAHRRSRRTPKMTQAQFLIVSCDPTLPLDPSKVATPPSSHEFGGDDGVAEAVRDKKGECGAGVHGGWCCMHQRDPWLLQWWGCHVVVVVAVVGAPCGGCGGGDAREVGRESMRHSASPQL